MDINTSNTLILTKDEVKELIDVSDTIDAVESAFNEYGRKNVQLPSKKYLYFEKHSGDYRSMPGYLEEEDIAGCKLVNVHPDNSNLPTVMAAVILVDPKTGFPFCIMDGTDLTAYRTGAAGAVATKYLSREDSKVLGLVGAGTQAKTQFLSIREIRDIEEVRIYDISTEAAKDLKMLINEEGVDAYIEEEVEDLVKASDVITTVTPVREPIIMDEWVSDGTHINAVGADAKGKQELESKILKRGKIIVDQLEPTKHGGEINVPFSKGEIDETDIQADIGEVITGDLKGRENYADITIFDSTGLAIQDISTAWNIYKKANNSGIGQQIPLLGNFE